MTGWTEEAITRAWRALAQQELSEEWRFLDLTTIGSASIKVGCHFPFGKQALIVSFTGATQELAERLPEGRGFDLITIKDRTIKPGSLNFALVRRLDGAPDIFGTMVFEILQYLETLTEASDGKLVHSFLERVRAWQDFMTRTQRPLSTDAQVGLLGELWMLQLLVDSKLASDALGCWKGPLAAAQDFHVSTGAIEVKSTTSSADFRARINSIEQLDADRAPMFLCAFRFKVTPDGRSLTELVARLREVFGGAGSRGTFDSLLMIMGYNDQHATDYGRRYALIDTKIFRSEGEMPPLKRAKLPVAVRSASYVLDLDALRSPTVGFAEVLDELGILHHES